MWKVVAALALAVVMALASAEAAERRADGVRARHAATATELSSGRHLRRVVVVRRHFAPQPRLAWGYPYYGYPYFPPYGYSYPSGAHYPWYLSGYVLGFGPRWYNY